MQRRLLMIIVTCLPWITGADCEERRLADLDNNDLYVDDGVSLCGTCIEDPAWTIYGDPISLEGYPFRETVEEVLEDYSVAFPLTRAMCAPIGDGSAAALLCSERALQKYPDAKPVKILASTLASGSLPGSGIENIGERLSREAYEMAGVGPEDVDVAEVHDATAFGELMQCEELGFCPQGEGGPFAESGATKVGGKLPVNPSGGLECRGHPIGASGLAQIYELVTQLRGEAGARQVEGVKIALAENGGGFIGLGEAAMCVHILGKA